MIEWMRGTWKDEAVAFVFFVGAFVFARGQLAFFLDSTKEQPVALRQHRQSEAVPEVRDDGVYCVKSEGIGFTCNRGMSSHINFNSGMSYGTVLYLGGGE